MRPSAGNEREFVDGGLAPVYAFQVYRQAKWLRSILLPIRRETLMDFNNTPTVDEAAVRRFIEIIHTHAAQVLNGAERTGVLQLCRINPADENEVVPSRFRDR